MLPIIHVLIRIITNTITILFKWYYLLQLYQTFCLPLDRVRPSVGIPIFTIFAGMTFAVLYPAMASGDMAFYVGFLVLVYWYVYRAAGMRVGGVLLFLHDLELRRGMER